MTRKNLSAAFAAVGIFVLILDSANAAQWASEGIELCMRTVIPSLFPFFVVSGCLTGNISTSRFLSPVARCFSVGDSGTPALICGFLGGYPVGAISIAQRWKHKSLSTDEARRMLSFCSQAGPSFLFGMVSGCFTSRSVPWILWGIQIISAWMVSRISPMGEISQGKQEQSSGMSFAEALHNGLYAMAAVCGWVTLFRVILGFCGRWFFWLFPSSIQVLLCGLLELANGCCKLNQIGDESLRFVVCAVILNFGGLCVLMQTMSAVGPLGIREYLRGKILQTVFALMISLPISGIIPPWNLSLILPLMIFTGKRRKISRFPAIVDV